jgi:hypothetical protein
MAHGLKQETREEKEADDGKKEAKHAFTYALKSL